MKKFWIYCFFAFCLLSYELVFAQDASNSILFYANFDKNLNAETPSKSEKPLFKRIKTTNDGYLGKGVQLLESGYLCYQNISFPNNGTLSFRLNVDKETVTDLREAFLFMLDFSGKEQFSLHLKKDTLFLFVGDDEVSAKTIIAEQLDFYPEEWHQIVITWKKDAELGGVYKGGSGRGEVKIYIDGKRVALNQEVKLPKRRKGDAYFGSNKKGAGSFHGILDDLKIYKQALDEKEISKYFNTGL
jgi:concanavalin A-like lectin/glucanase superfamily protein